jgi:beta-N-acetylhexosaminidase
VVLVLALGVMGEGSRIVVAQGEEGRRSGLGALRPLTRSEEAWVTRTLAGLTVEEKVGQLVMADANLVFWNQDGVDYQKMRHHLVDNKVGGVLLFRSEVWPSAILANRWQEMAKVPLLIAADLEMGLGMRFDDTPWWAPNMAVAATGDPRWAAHQGEATALQARAMGVNWLYAPTADVNNNPDNPVINTRSFGEDPQEVATYVRAFVEGAQGAGVLACAKHFPGHGDTATDSHIGLPVIDVDRARLSAVELVPFRAAIRAGIGSIMSAHIALPRIETEMAAPVRMLSEREAATAEFVSRTESTAGQVTLPGTLSSKVLTGLLREELRFEGLVVTDAMNMAGIAARYTPGEAAVKAVLAGADVVIKPSDLDAAITGLREAVARGEISRARLDRSVERILRAKARLGLHRQRQIAVAEVDRVVNAPRFLETAQAIADRSLTLVRDERNDLETFRQRIASWRAGGPPPKLFHLTYTDEEDRTATRHLEEEWRAQGLPLESHVLDRSAGDSELAAALATIDQSRADLILLSLPVRARSGKGSVSLPPTGQRLAEELTRRNRPLLVVSFGNPYLLMAIPAIPSYLVAWSPFQVSQRAVAKALLGSIPIGGTLPVSLPGLYPRSHGLRLD